MLGRLLSQLWRRSPAAQRTPTEGHERRWPARSGRSIEQLRALVEADPNDVELLVELGTTEGERGLLETAVAHLSRAVSLAPEHGPARISLANALLASDQARAALPHYEAGLRWMPDSAVARCNLGKALMALGDAQAAEVQLKRAIELDSALAAAHHHLARIAEVRGDPTSAWQAYDAALRAAPGYAAALNDLTQLLVRHGEEGAALDTIERCASRAPPSATIPACLGFVYHAQGRLDEAIEQFRISLDRNPNDAEVIKNLAVSLQQSGHIEEAVALHDKALALRPNFVQARWHRSLALLAKQDFTTGWDDYDLRLLSEVPPPRHIPLPHWDGRPLPQGRLLVYAEQGLGDQIMFASCLPDVLRRVGECTVECLAKLAPLLARSFPGTRVVGTDQSSDTRWVADLQPLDFAIPIGSLAQLFRRSLDTFPQHSGYLLTSDEKSQRWRTRLDALGPGLKVGISWQGGSKNARANLRSIPLEHWLPILSTPGAHFVSLQYTECNAELAELRNRYGITVTHWQAAIDDYDETAALVAALDLVISVQTAVIHLAGALGKTCWVLVSAAPEWRYGLTGEHMPWYPSVRLFRQRELQRWTEVVDRVAAALAQDFPTCRTPTRA